MSKVWMVTSGCYSDYHVVGVFSSEENALKFRDSFPKEIASYGGLDVSEIILDPCMNEINRGLIHYTVSMFENGDIEMCENNGKVPWEFGDRIVFGMRKAPVIWCEVWARDQQHAVKIVNERRAMAIANGEFDKVKNR